MAHKELKNMGGSQEDLIDVYLKQIRCLLEYGAPVWNGSLTSENIEDIEGVQKAFMHILLQDKYTTYENALKVTKLKTLEDRRKELCYKFALKASEHKKHTHWFQKQDIKRLTRSNKLTYTQPFCRTEKYKKSAIPYLTDLLNTHIQ